MRAVLALLIALLSAGPPSWAREDDTGLAPPTEQELAAVCPDETVAWAKCFRGVLRCS